MSEAIPVPSATVMLVRDRRSGPGVEVFMMERSLGGDFGGLYVFPGGKVDLADSACPSASQSGELTEAEARAVLRVEEGGVAHWVACVRECFEEAGVLLARTADGEIVELHDARRRSRIGAFRDRLNQGDGHALHELCEREGLRLAIDHLAYVAHWITPVDQPRRYDTRFFVARAPARQEAIHDGHEAVESLWIAPEDALERHRAGEMAMISPTLRNLRGLCGFTDAERLLAAKHAIDPGEIRTIVPRIGARGEEIEEVVEVPETRPLRCRERKP